MSAIDTTFHFVRNPTAINGLATTYVSKRGSDTTGDGTAQNPYASIAKATSVATSKTNIMLDDGEWSEARTMNNRGFHWWGNANTKTTDFYFISSESYHFIDFFHPAMYSGYQYPPAYAYNCIIINKFKYNGYDFATLLIDNCIVVNSELARDGVNGISKDSVLINSALSGNRTYAEVHNCLLINTRSGIKELVNCNVFTDNIDTSKSIDCINNSITGQSYSDYFNHIIDDFSQKQSQNTIGYDDIKQCDFTAKAGSKNIGAGEKGSTIGLNQGYTMYADNSANDVFSPSNGATLKNIAWDSTLNGYVLVQKDRVCQGATSTTITLDSSASAVDDYYNNLFVGIVGGDGYGELFLITDYDGATKTATIDGTWTTTPTTNSIYTISGTILSAVKDLGKAIKVKRNWTFADNFVALQDGQWAEFMTHVETNGKQFPVSCYSYEYSTDGVNFIQGQTADDLVSATNSENKVTDAIYGDCSPNYDEATAKNLVMRYIRVRVHIGFNIGQ